MAQLLNWKSIIALGAAISVIILSSKTDPESAGQVLTRWADACKEAALAVKGER